MANCMSCFVLLAYNFYTACLCNELSSGRFTFYIWAMKTYFSLSGVTIVTVHIKKTSNSLHLTIDMDERTLSFNFTLQDHFIIVRAMFVQIIFKSKETLQFNFYSVKKKWITFTMYMYIFNNELPENYRKIIYRNVVNIKYNTNN